ncbi:MAG: aminoacetone oxidase family FAD-binding enzyme [Bacteroidaceae bacterium]|nr:aminoacetone oxidase family FAD-binding enzyme [Bacteroidaceae bacterium]
MRVAIIGAGAAGCFCAIELKRRMPEAEVTVFERGRRPLAKVAVTGGGRCNLTNSFRGISDLSKVYPRGARLMERLLRHFSPEDCRRWWEREGVRLVIQEDECVFPQSQDAMEIVGTLLRLMRQLGVRLLTNAKAEQVKPQGVGYEIIVGNEAHLYDVLVVTTGGAPRRQGLSFLDPLDLRLESPVPSLFALNVDDKRLQSLSGTVAASVSVAFAGTRFCAEGPLLLTHFGVSGPAILRLSSYAARWLAERDYRAALLINWMEGRDEQEVGRLLDSFQRSDRLVANHHPEWLSSRLWAMLLERANISASQRWDALNKRERNRLIATLTADTYHTDGRRTYKGEFVTAGGISLREIDPNTLSLKRFPRLFVAGEVTDVDGVTGGFNLQAAWTMGWAVAQSIAAQN